MKVLSTSLLLLLLLFASTQSQATHVMGADITWECLGNNKYKVITTVYRDCNGVNLSNTRMTFRGSCNGIKTTSQTVSAGRDITPVCPTQCTRCSSKSCSFQYGVQEYKLTTTIDVSNFKKNGCCDVAIAWSQCCRNGAITTGASHQNFYIQAKMDICTGSCNNSPVFGSSPVSIFCLGRDVILNAGAFDKDTVNGTSDSLVHSLVDPRTSSGGRTSWKKPFSSQKPLSYFGFPKDYSVNKFPSGFHFDSSSGELMFKPMKLEQTVLSIRVEEYRHGKKIGEIHRDIQVIIIKCPSNHPPVISGANCSAPKSTNFKMYACAGKPICFDICTFDKDKNDTVTIGWNQGIPGANFSVINKGNSRRETGRFCWTPKLSDVGHLPYRFTVTAQDNACPTNILAVRTFSVYVGEAKKTSINTSATATSCGNYNLVATTLDSKSNVAWEWYLNDTTLIGKTGAGKSSKIDHKFPTNGTYPVKIMTTRSGCWETFYDTVIVSGLKPIKLPNIADQVLCADKRIKIPFTATGGDGGLTYNWAATNTLSNGSLTTDEIHATFKNYFHRSIITYTATDSNGCSVTKDFVVQLKQLYEPQLAPDKTLCGDDTLYSDTLPIPATGTFSGGKWSGPGVSRNVFTPKGLGTGSYILSYNKHYYNYCVVDDVHILIADNPVANAGLDRSTCSSSSPIKLGGSPSGGTWTGPKNTISNSSEFLPKKASLGSNVLTYRVVDSNGCEDTDTLKITVHQLPSVSAGSDIQHCFVGPKDKITLSGTPSGGLWKGYQLFGTNNVVEIAANDIGSFVYTYQVSNSAGCSNTDKMTLTIREKPNVDAGLDDTLCLSSTISKPLIGKPAGGKWLGGNLSKNGGKYFAELSTTTLYQHTYEYEFTDNFGCTNSDEMNIYVGEETTTDFTPSVTSGNAPLKVDFTNKSTNGVNWYWNFGNGKNSTSFEPSFTYLGGGTFKVILLTVDGTGYCHSTNSESIAVKGGVGISNIPDGLVSLYPSPANESFVVENETGKDLNFTLYNETGQIVLERKVGVSARFDVQTLPKGYYFYKMISADGQFHQDKLIIE